MGVVLQLLCRILSPLFLAVRSLLSSCEAGKSRKSLKEHREKYIFKHSGSYSLLQCKADCSYLNFFRNRRTVVISVQVCLLLLLWWWWWWWWWWLLLLLLLLFSKQTIFSRDLRISNRYAMQIYLERVYVPAIVSTVHSCEGEVLML